MFDFTERLSASQVFNDQVMRVFEDALDSIPEPCRSCMYSQLLPLVEFHASYIFSGSLEALDDD